MMSLHNEKLHRLLDAFNEGADQVLRLFDEKAIVEYPYAPALGLPGTLDMAAYHRHLTNILSRMPDIIFSNIRIYPTSEENTLWAEFHGETFIPPANAKYEQDYVVKAVFKDEKFIHYREYWNVAPILKSLSGNDAIKTTLV